MDLLFCNRRNRRAEHDDALEVDDTKLLAKKSGFISIQDRVASLAEQEKNATSFKRRSAPNARDGDVRPARQYATLQELFSSKSNLQRPYSVNSGDEDNLRGCGEPLAAHKRPKIPVMKLTKDDWNVKCWEERLSSHKKRQQQAATRSCGPKHQSLEARRLRLPERQVEVFQDRIEDVAKKLDKVREGAPLDEKLYELALNKNREVKTSHDWTDMLKRELEKGTHNPKQLRTEFAALAARPDAKSPLGRPIRKIFQNQEEDDD